MKKIIILFVFMFLTINVFGVDTETVENMLATIHTNQPTWEEISFPNGSKTDEELKQLKAKLNADIKTNAILKKKLIEIAKTNNYVKNIIAEELLKYSLKSMNSTCADSFYQSDLLVILKKTDIYKVFECAKTIINSDEYEKGWRFEGELHGYWLRGKLTAEQVHPLFIKLATGEHKNKDAVQVLLGSKYYKPLDKEVGEQIVRSWIEEETNVEEKLKYYRVLDSAGIKDPEYVNILKSIMDDPDESLFMKTIYVEQLERIGATNNPIIKEEVDNIKRDYEQETIDLRSGSEEALIRTSPDQPITNAEGRIYHIIK